MEEKKLDKKYWRWHHPNWSILRVKEADQRFLIKKSKNRPLVAYFTNLLSASTTHRIDQLG
jgi:hypothetical protein